MRTALYWGDVFGSDFDEEKALWRAGSQVVSDEMQAACCETTSGSSLQVPELLEADHSEPLGDEFMVNP